MENYASPIDFYNFSPFFDVIISWYIVINLIATLLVGTEVSAAQESN